MVKIDVVKVIKIAGLVMSMGGTIANSWAGKKENDKVLEKLVNERLKKR